MVRMSESVPQVRHYGRARVVVADDHSRIRTAIEEVLSSSFDVVAAVADGRHAVDAIDRLDPDVVVLDITMPVLDGLSAARELVGRGVRAKVVFLSVHEGDEYVAAAVEAGGEGYVVKSRLVTDLKDAITHVLNGRLRVPTSSSLLGVADRRAKHAIQFDTTDDARLDELNGFATRALRCGDTVVAVGRPAMLSGMASRLTDSGFDLTSLSACGRYQVFNAEESLSHIMRGDEPDEASLVELVRRLKHASGTASDGASTGLVVFGELAALLVRDGNIDGALALERIWHRYASFHTLCSYCRADVKADGGRQIFDQLCAVHHAVSS
jgi:DNA-binding NarL/FixJ family response regulator